MKIREVTISTTDLDAAADFYRNKLGLQVAADAGRVTVNIGFSKLVLTPGAPFEGVHHLAFGISPDDFDLARKWLRRQVEPITVNAPRPLSISEVGFDLPDVEQATGELGESFGPQG
ncbi:VOC family protein [Nocardia sp. NPDC051321]|uniref:VOC family protein n=1 Tax=Nocardia sp. NPDC051321 TaxID=3364323 RepID=UPI0037B519A8